MTKYSQSNGGRHFPNFTCSKFDE